MVPELACRAQAHHCKHHSYKAERVTWREQKLHSQRYEQVLEDVEVV